MTYPLRSSSTSDIYDDDAKGTFTNKIMVELRNPDRTLWLLNFFRWHGLTITQRVPALKSTFDGIFVAVNNNETRPLKIHSGR
jgi:hypothetical protein